MGVESRRMENHFNVEEEITFEGSCSHNFIPDQQRGVIVCRLCGLVSNGRQFVDALYDYYQQNRNNGSQYNTMQFVGVGERPTRDDGLGSEIGYASTQKNFRDYRNRPIPSRTRRLFERLKRQYNRFRHGKRESEFKTLTTFMRIAGILQMNTQMRERCAYNYRKFVRRLKKGDFHNHLNLLAVAIYIESKRCTPAVFTIREICDAFRGHRVSPKSLIRTHLMIEPKCQDLLDKQTSRKAEDYLPKFVSNIISHREVRQRIERSNIDPNIYEVELLKKSYTLLSNFTIEDRGSRSPCVLAGAAIYTASRLLLRLYNGKSGRGAILSLRLISDVTGLRETSMRDHWKFVLKPYLEGGKAIASQL